RANWLALGTRNSPRGFWDRHFNSRWVQCGRRADSFSATISGAGSQPCSTEAARSLLVRRLVGYRKFIRWAPSNEPETSQRTPIAAAFSNALMRGWILVPDARAREPYAPIVNAPSGFGRRL